METTFADDLNCYATFAPEIRDEDILDRLKLCQDSLHAWGRGNQVSFDASKESVHILHDKRPLGEPFPLLGITFDACLDMRAAVYELAAIGHTRVTTVLRLRRFYSSRALFSFYKAQVLGKIEFATPAIYHATSFILSALDRVQNSFLESVGISAEAALLDFQLAPLIARRDIAMLGMIHKIVHGRAPPQFGAVVRFAHAPCFPRSLRGPGRRHNKQLHDPCLSSCSGLLNRSWLRLIYTWNLLPQHVVDILSTSRFQSVLQTAVKNATRSHVSDWESVLRRGVQRMSVSGFQMLFD